MSPGEGGKYKFDHTIVAKEQIRSIAAKAADTGKLQEFIAILKDGVRLMETDPQAWGDPEFRSKSGEGVIYHGIIRPVAFRYLVYAQIRAVVLLGVRLYAEFE